MKKRALISVSDKAGILEFAQALIALDFEILSTGGTADLLSKAGVPRYAELVSVSDDPGEAAANYYLLKLMGFPDVKAVLL